VTVTNNIIIALSWLGWTKSRKDLGPKWTYNSKWVLFVSSIGLGLYVKLRYGQGPISFAYHIVLWEWWLDKNKSKLQSESRTRMLGTW